MNSIQATIKDLTPSQRAALKLWEQAIAIVFLNAIISGVAYLDSFKTIDVKMLITIVLSQLLLGACNVAVKYLKASGQLPLSVTVQAAANEIAARVPAAPVESANLQTASAAVASLFSNTLEVSAKGNDPVALASQPINDEPALSVTTLPNITALK